jgi:chromosome segregation ATPase
MNRSKSWLGVVGILLGGLGIVLCVAALVMLGIVSARLGRATDRVFASLDQSLVAVRQRVGHTQDRLEVAKITAGEVGDSLRDWASREAAQSIAERMNIRKRTNRLAASLEQVDGWLEVVQSSIEMTHDVLAIGVPAGENWSNIDSPAAAALALAFDQLLERLASVRAQLAAATEAIANLRARLDATGGEREDQSEPARIQQALEISVRLIATLGLVDFRLQQFDQSVSAAQTRLQELQARTQWWLRLATWGSALVILLMAAGQVALCRLAWNGLRPAEQ